MSVAPSAVLCYNLPILNPPVVLSWPPNVLSVGKVGVLVLPRSASQTCFTMHLQPSPSICEKISFLSSSVPLI